MCLYLKLKWCRSIPANQDLTHQTVKKINKDCIIPLNGRIPSKQNNHAFKVMLNWTSFDKLQDKSSVPPSSSISY